MKYISQGPRTNIPVRIVADLIKIFRIKSTEKKNIPISIILNRIEKKIYIYNDIEKLTSWKNTK